MTLGNLSSINLVSIFRCSSSPRNPVYVRLVDPSVLDFSLSIHRHPHICFPCSSPFSVVHNKYINSMKLTYKVQDMTLSSRRVDIYKEWVSWLTMVRGFDDKGHYLTRCHWGDEVEDGLKNPNITGTYISRTRRWSPIKEKTRNRFSTSLLDVEGRWTEWMMNSQCPLTVTFSNLSYPIFFPLLGSPRPPIHLMCPRFYICLLLINKANAK